MRVRKKTMSKKTTLPSHALIVTEYGEFRQLVRAFAEGHHEVMTVIGDPGVGKSEIVRRIMQQVHGGIRWGMVKGKHSPLKLYEKLYRFRLLPLVLDDLDALFQNADNTTLLKCIGDTSPVKRAEWGSNHPAFTKRENPLPTSFESISQVCIIANAWETVNKNIAAIHDRGLLVLFRPTALEVHMEIARAGWFNDEEVFTFIGRNLFLVSQPSFRFYNTARNHKAAGLDWRGLTLRTMESEAAPKLILVARLLASSEYDEHKASEAAREQAFEAMDGGSRATYHRYKRELLKRRGHLNLADVQAVQLQPARPDLHLLAAMDRRRQLEELRDQDSPQLALRESAQLDGTLSDALSDQSLQGDASARLDQLRKSLERAVKRENYELAATLRDEIRRVENNRKS